MKLCADNRAMVHFLISSPKSKENITVRCTFGLILLGDSDMLYI